MVTHKNICIEYLKSDTDGSYAGHAVVCYALMYTRTNEFDRGYIYVHHDIQHMYFVNYTKCNWAFRTALLYKVNRVYEL